MLQRLFFILLICGSPPAFSQEKNLELAPIENSLDPRIRQSLDLIDDIKSNNLPDDFRAEWRSGLMQVFANSVDAVELNRLKSLPFTGIETVTKIYGDTGLELRGYHAQNFLFEPTPGSPNGSSAYQTSYDAGLRHRFILDPTQRADYVALKVLYSNTQNNFKLSDPQILYMSEYTGFIAGVERSIQVTPKIGILASLDVNVITEAKSNSTVIFQSEGIGFSIRGSGHYRVDWFGIPSKIGGAYWQGGIVNRLGPNAQSDLARTSHVQSFRAVSGSFVVYF